MALATSLKSRRKSRQAPTQAPTQQFLEFEITQQAFALPIAQVLKVIPLTTIYGDPTGRGIGLVNYQGQEILVIDIETILFPHSSTSPKAPYQFLLILQAADNPELLGIPIHQPPHLIRISSTAIAPLPAHYRTLGNIHGVSTRIVNPQAPDVAPVFIIDLAQILTGLEQLPPESPI